ncbi:hypothetical protein KCU81_g89, partial [Aureobasidium melanogenum]
MPPPAESPPSRTVEGSYCSMTWSEQTGFEFSRMTLHLVAMLIYRAKVVGTTVDVENDAVTLVVGSHSVVIVLAHLDPFALQGDVRPPPLPPLLTSDSLQACGTKLCFDKLCGALGGNPLTSEGLDVFDGLRDMKHGRIHAVSREMFRCLACEKKVSMTEGVTSAATPRVLKTMANLFG